MFRAHFALTMLFALLFSAALPAPARAQDATDTEAVATSYVEAMNAVFASGDVAALDAVVSPDYVNHTPSPTRDGGVSSPDLAGLKSSFEAVHAVFPDATVTVVEAIVEGDNAALLVNFDGMGGPDTDSDGVIILKIADGLVVESWNFEAGGAERMQPMFEATPAA